MFQNGGKSYDTCPNSHNLLCKFGEFMLINEGDMTPFVKQQTEARTYTWTDLRHLIISHHYNTQLQCTDEATFGMEQLHESLIDLTSSAFVL